MLSALLLGAPAFIVLSAVQDEALVTDAGSVRHADLARIKTVIEQHDPRQLRDGETRSLEITERDLNLVLNSTLPYADRQRWKLELSGGEALALFTLALPANPLGNYLNVSARLQQQGPKLAMKELRFGDTTVPGWLLNPVISVVDGILERRNSRYRDLHASLRQITIRPQALQLVYQWNTELADHIQATGRDLLLPPEDRRRVLAYYGETVLQSRAMAGRTVSLDRLMQPLFALAEQRSAGSGDPASENRALLLALGIAVQGSSIRHLTGEMGGAERPLPLRLTLRGRKDLAQHFIISSALAAAAGTGLADTVGLFKEVDDSRGGSGFSFADLLADRAGVTLAQAALGSRAAAVQRYMAENPQESGYMPPFDQLPEGLMELEFKARFEDIDSATYALVDDEIERRIGACELHRG